MTLKERMAAKAGDSVVVHWLVPDAGGEVKSNGFHVNMPYGFEVFGGGQWAIACGEKRENCTSLSPVTHVVNCPACMRHPGFADKYEPAPWMKRYEQIPAGVREIIEAAEQAGG